MHLFLAKHKEIQFEFISISLAILHSLQFMELIVFQFPCLFSFAFLYQSYKFKIQCNFPLMADEMDGENNMKIYHQAQGAISHWLVVQRVAFECHCCWYRHSYCLMCNCREIQRKRLDMKQNPCIEQATRMDHKLLRLVRIFGPCTLWCNHLLKLQHHWKKIDFEFQI